MKHVYYLFLLPLVALCMQSCDMTARSTPFVQFAGKMVRTSAAGLQDTITLADTLHVGDTIRLQLALQGGYNSLTSFETKADSTALRTALEVIPEQLHLLTTGTDFEHGKLAFVQDKVTIFITTLRYTPRRAGSHRVEMLISSSAGEKYSPQYYSFETTVK